MEFHCARGKLLWVGGERGDFGKAARELSDAECAMVVGIIRGPHAFSPMRNPEAALEQRHQTLLRMETMGFVSAQRREALEKQPLKLAENHADPSQASYALQAVRAELDRVLNDEQLRAGGAVVKTTLDAAWQERLETELNTAVRSLDRARIAACKQAAHAAATILHDGEARHAIRRVVAEAVQGAG